MLNSVGYIPKYIYIQAISMQMSQRRFFINQKCTYSLLDPFILHLFFRLIILFPYMRNFQLGTPKGIL